MVGLSNHVTFSFKMYSNLNHELTVFACLFLSITYSEKNKPEHISLICRSLWLLQNYEFFFEFVLPWLIQVAWDISKILPQLHINIKFVISDYFARISWTRWNFPSFWHLSKNEILFYKTFLLFHITMLFFVHCLRFSFKKSNFNEFIATLFLKGSLSPPLLYLNVEVLMHKPLNLKLY